MPQVTVLLLMPLQSEGRGGGTRVLDDKGSAACCRLVVSVVVVHRVHVLGVDVVEAMAGFQHVAVLVRVPVRLQAGAERDLVQVVHDAVLDVVHAVVQRRERVVVLVVPGAVFVVPGAVPVVPGTVVLVLVAVLVHGQVALVDVLLVVPQAQVLPVQVAPVMADLVLAGQALAGVHLVLVQGVGNVGDADPEPVRVVDVPVAVLDGDPGVTGLRRQAGQGDGGGREHELRQLRHYRLA